MDSDNYHHFIAVRKMKHEGSYQYDIYFNKGKHPRYIGRAKKSPRFIITKNSKDAVLDEELNNPDKKSLELLINILNSNNNEYMRLVWLRCLNEEEQFLYIDERK